MELCLGPGQTDRWLVPQLVPALDFDCTRLARIGETARRQPTRFGTRCGLFLETENGLFQGDLARIDYDWLTLTKPTGVDGNRTHLTHESYVTPVYQTG